MNNRRHDCENKQINAIFIDYDDQTSLMKLREIIFMINMSSIDEKKKQKLKFYIVQERQRKKQQEMQHELERKIYHLQRTICELQNKKQLLLLKFKQLLDEEIEITKRRYMEKTSACSKNSTTKKKCVEVKTIVHTNDVKTGKTSTYSFKRPNC